MAYLIAIVGIIVTLGLGYLLSTDRQGIKFKSIIIMLVSNFFTAWFMFTTTIGKKIIDFFTLAFDKLIEFGTAGVNFVFGGIETTGFVFMFNVLLIIVFFSTLLAIFNYTKILPYTIKLVGGALAKLTGLPKIESFNAVNSIFFGTSEALLAIKTQLDNLDKNRLYVVSASAMNSVAASIIASYMALLPPKYVLAALPLNMFSALIISSLVMPVNVPKDEDVIEIKDGAYGDSFFEAMVDGALDGLKIAGNVAGILIAFIATMGLANYLVAELAGLFGYDTNLQMLIGYLLSPFAFLMGIPASEIVQAGSIMGTKLILNEFVAILDFNTMIPDLTEKTIGIISVFLISFANFSTVGQISGTLKALSAKQAKVASGFSVRLLIGATLTSMLSATIAGLFI
ncbi:pyrimidine nucleoside transporter NupC [Vulcanibacillus modesticaldus]|uniref:Pyrimidine nucleoside transporter NupC n=1 Tax=Vulcanibacillus modesticaldus TaxID=337097 RepID=A0A1D2YSR4_9BACI|nr:nucleoside transporter C-terminal domain-containing protein [Vulcanibacillus modesticaldus]OEF97634.1 pyrimidine nucleoside transporter NupC [Vulcanibacillus modesticaldus]